ncbi:MAG: glucose-1-phosphate adenylyltransferase [Candidatus Gastranaerophilales bacterium]|nr:glucose-1-phosphate adenylyltransferase [Candidatus Gastranaerophilales bacterium]
MNDTLVMILAGGEGRRLYPLTKDRAKPAVPFGGRYRIIDFVINNFVNSGFYKIKVLTQYKSDSLNKHIVRGWPLSPIVNQYVDLVPAQMRTGGEWYTGTADAVYQNMNAISDENPHFVCIFGGDSVFKMDISQMMKCHKKNLASLTISAIPVPLSEAHKFGIMEVDEHWKLTAFKEKPTGKVKEMPGKPGYALASMGNYIFDNDILQKALSEDAKDENSSHDFGKDIIPKLLREGYQVFVYDFSSNTHPGMSETEQGYWRDVGDVDAYWQANMDLLAYEPEFNLYNMQWPLRTYNYNYPPARFVREEEDRTGMAIKSLVSEGCVISGGKITRCVLSPNVRVNSFAQVTDSILMEDVQIGRNAVIQKAIIDKVVKIPDYAKIGVDKEEDIKRGFYVSPNGVTVVPKGAKLYV